MTKEEAIDWWINLESVSPLINRDGPETELAIKKGKLERLPDDFYDYDRRHNFIHIHEDDDSYMYVEGRLYKHVGHKSNYI